jgi:two-component system chemotaxis sensor kinase CheA
VREAGLRQAERRGKRVRIEIDGEDVPAPAQLHPLFAVLPHLIRNAIDHGIELPEARIGKPEIGTIRITVRPNDTMTRIEVMDDGAGINPGKIVATAIERGLITPEAAANLNDEERLALVFLPGLSSAETVTDTSGRGIGTSAVEAAVIALGGFVSISSREGEGCRFVINVPTNPRRRSIMPLRPSIRPL